MNGSINVTSQPGGVCVETKVLLKVDKLPSPANEDSASHVVQDSAAGAWQH